MLMIPLLSDHSALSIAILIVICKIIILSVITLTLIFLFHFPQRSIPYVTLKVQIDGQPIECVCKLNF